MHTTKLLFTLITLLLGLTTLSSSSAQPHRSAPARHGTQHRQQTQPHRDTRPTAQTTPAERWDCAGTMPEACGTLLSIRDLDGVPEPARGDLIRAAALAGNAALGTRDTPNACAARCLVAVAVQRLNTNNSAEAERVGLAVAHVIPGEARNACVLGMAVLRNTAARAAAASSGAASDCAAMGAPQAARALVFDCLAVPDQDAATLRTMAARTLSDAAFHCLDTGYLGATYLALAQHDDPAATLIRTFPLLPGGLTGARRVAVAEQVSRGLSAANRDDPAVRNLGRSQRTFLREAVAAGIPASAPPMVSAANTLIRLDGAGAQVSSLNLGEAMEDLLFLQDHGLLDDVRIAQAVTAIPFEGMAGASVGGPERARYRRLAEIFHAARDPHATLAALSLDAALAVDGEHPDDCTAAREMMRSVQRFRGSEAARVFPVALYTPLLQRIAVRGLGMAQRCSTAEPERAVFFELTQDGAAPQQRNDFVGDERVTASRAGPRSRARRP